MSNKLDQIIDISINFSTKTITQQGFGIAMFLGESMKLDRKVKSYSNITEVGIDFAETDPEYKMALTAFSQERTPPTIKIGKKVVASTTAIIEATNPIGDIVNINSTNHNLESGASVTVSGFAQAEYNGTFEIIKVDNDNFQYTATTTPTVSTATGSGSYVAFETWSNAIQQCYNYDSDWYGLGIVSNVKADILNSAQTAEALQRIFVARTSDVNNLDSSDVTSVLYELKQLQYDRTLTIYNENTTDYFPDAALLGRQLSTIPGSSNWAFKTLIGILPDNLTASQEIFNNNGNTYEAIAGRSIIRYGYVSSGEYIDIIRGSDWLKARLQESLYLVLINQEKIPYSYAGGVIIENNMRVIFEEAVENGFIASNQDNIGEYTITIPNIADIPNENKLARLFSGISFTAKLSGAINKISIAGNITV